MRRVISVSACGLALAVTAAPAHAAGGPVPPAFGGAGVSAPNGDDNFIAVHAGAGRSVVMRVRRGAASVQRSRTLHGSYGVPGVSYDGINTGLSADGGTLVLAQPITSYPMRTTKLQVLDAGSLRPRERLELRGMLTVDAISPTGRWLYLVDYKHGNLTHYDVRAYDLEHGRMLKKPIVDPREPEEKLQGVPVTRVSSGESRWAYTLYAGDEPFIHALDTEGRTAVCIDLPQISTADAADIKLALNKDELTVRRAGEPIAYVDLKSFEVAASKPAPPAPTPKPEPAAKAADAGPPLILWAIPLAVFAALALAARRRGVTLTGRDS